MSEFEEPDAEFQRLTTRIKEIDGELISCGAIKLQKEREDLRAALKQWMISHETRERRSEAMDKIITLTPSYKDVWDPDALRPFLTREQADRVIKVDTYVVPEEVNALVKSGVLKREDLEKAGAVIRELISASLRT